MLQVGKFILQDQEADDNHNCQGYDQGPEL